MRSSGPSSLSRRAPRLVVLLAGLMTLGLACDESQDDERSFGSSQFYFASPLAGLLTLDTGETQVDLVIADLGWLSTVSSLEILVD